MSKDEKKSDKPDSRPTLPGPDRPTPPVKPEGDIDNPGKTPPPPPPTNP